jgi:uncharacterized ferritin-like protein (DUF455 family)
MQELGAAPGLRPTSMLHWDIGFGKPLPVALTCHQLIGEWTGVDAAIYLGDYFRDRGDSRTAMIFDFVARDEARHVSFGNKWLAWLVPDEQGRDAVRAEAEQVRAEHGKIVDGPLTFPFNRWACEASGYSQTAIERLEQRYRNFGSRHS